MNLVQIATSAVSIPIPYLAKVAEGAAQKAGESVEQLGCTRVNTMWVRCYKAATKGDR
ncbi:hypothetical protein [Moorena sp. SIO3I8]|uniref:hypothetical protein n=1 Tax=Moorena sp. SIO3I8 TaxID=2607833 RepID=UPI0013C0A9A4|nr:hypothetical protein [Moorena sp. SIO3I8]NEO09926.1 hypothetical protein [Moorena sp. SIO3I8]